ncbi:PVC-type heme-binding CxxCH protein [Rubripirellula reticaptiva]|uniref:Trehalose utilization n=1 Tax=Rubripirellula reticaptiva TaxID=2528013 RepID=A0A5C6EL00_9BACT|nr:PVC-type heme-binding CxxCH protein [Rubripirellula reticaptiva]TWU49170.1 Trehalose utilization [Rubripirellula reticaptiva]
MKFLVAIVFALSGLLMALSPSVGHCEDIRVLFLGDSGSHQPKVRFDELQPILNARGIKMTYTDQVADVNLAKLKQFDAFALYANIDEIDKGSADALLDYVAGGGGFVPLHCATFCFRNQPELVALMGAQFQRHGTGVFRAEDSKSGHELMSGFGGFKSWDETYVHHLHNEKDRTVLEYRVDAEGREPWTWVRTEGDGRVFYTAWGHDGRTWTNPGFQNLVERGIRWATGNDPQAAGDYLSDRPFDVPNTTEMPKDLKPFEYVDVGGQIPNYTPSKDWGVQGEPLSTMQKPVEPTESLKHIVVPEGLHVELFASEPDLGGKPICMAWDERGRLWVAETVDYPNELQPRETARDRIRICEDTTGDGKADKFTVFAEELSIPTSIAFSRGGVIVQNATETLYLKDTDGDDKADERRVLISNWQLGDTHGGVSNFQYGLDNWIWAMQGYNQSQPIADGKQQQNFRMGFFRMKPDGSEVEFIRSTNNNTWGLGISEEGLIFGSTANGNPSIYMPIANRYYEQVRGWATSLTLSSIADTNDFHPITDKVRQVDHHGGYTAAAGHSLYTAREYPQEYWNRVGFVCGPTGHLVGSFVLDAKGSDFSSTSPFNLFASDDEWTAPIMAEVGPDGQVWVIDWYNYIVQHNPTPKGFKTGKGAAYETELRDKKHGRIYRLVANDSKQGRTPDLSKATPEELVSGLADPTMIVRKHAQRLLVERGEADVAESLFALIQSKSVDEIGLNVGAIHALWTLHGLGLVDGSRDDVNEVVFAALRHPSAGVRRNALQVLPPIGASIEAISAANVQRDANTQVRLAAVLAIADLPASDRGAKLVLDVISDPSAMADRWIPDAATSAAARNSGSLLTSLASVVDPSPRAIEIVGRAADHYARGDDVQDAAGLLASAAEADPRLLDAVVQGFAVGFGSAGNDSGQVQLTDAVETRLEEALPRVESGTRGMMVKLATRWGSKRFAKYGQEIADSMLAVVRDESAADQDRINAARQLVEFMPGDAGVMVSLLDEVNPRTPPAVAMGIIESMGASRSDSLGDEIVDRFSGMTPTLKKSAIVLLLKRPASTLALLRGIETGTATFADLALDQKQALASHSDRTIRDLATKLLKQGGSLPSADRMQVLEELSFVANTKGDTVKGKLAFTKHCSKCHMHSGEGATVGPDLTGMAVHPKEELLTHILDPNRNVEGNFRAYSVLTLDGVIINGMLASESKTSIELFDTEGKKVSVLRDDIDEFRMSTKSIMPEGFEKTMTPDELTDLLEFLVKRGKFVPIDLSKSATLPSDRSLFADRNNRAERLVFADWSPKTVAGVPFQLIDPRDGSVPNVIVLFSPNGEISRALPKSVSVAFNGPAKAIHLLSGVGGWAFPYGAKDVVALTVRLHYADGEREDHDLRNGKEFADYIRRVDVPDSQFAFDLRGQQIRYLAIHPKRQESITKIDFVTGPGVVSPVVMAITAE